MKKYLLSLLLVGLSFIGFSNATTVSLDCPGALEYCSPALDFGTTVDNICFDNLPNSYGIELYLASNGSDGQVVGNLNNYTSNCFDGGEFNKAYFYSIDYEANFPVSYTISYTINNSGGGESGGGNIGNLLPGGETALSGAISGLSGAVNEFIPYLVYITLGLLSAIIGFVAIKWLLRYTKGKTLGVFKSRRKK